MIPTQKHMTFMKAIINNGVLGSIMELMNACPNPEQLPDLENSLQFVKRCKERGCKVRVTDVVRNGCATCH